MALSGKIAAQLAKLLRKEVTKQFETPLPKPAVMRHGPLPDIPPEREGDVFATPFLPGEQAPITPVETSVDQLPIAEMDVLPEVPPVRTEIDESVPLTMPDRPSLRRQVEDLGLSKEEADEVLIPDAIDINQMPEVWKAPYRKAQEQGYSVPLFHFTRAGEEIQFDPKGEGTGYLNPLLLKEAEGKDIGIHLGTLSAMGKQNEMLGKPEAKVMGVTLRKQKEEQLGQSILPLVTKLDNVAIIPDMGRFKLPSKWLEELSHIDVELNPKKTIRHILRKDNLEKDFKKNKDIIKNTLDPSIETVDDLKKYVKENGDFIFWPEDGNFVYLKNEVKLSKLDKFIDKVSRMEGAKFDPLKGMSPTLWKQLMETAHTFHMKNIFRNTKQLDPESDMFIPKKIHPSLIDGWFKALWKILEDNGYDAFAYPNFVEDYGAFSYMFLDPKKVKSIFAKEFDPESFSFGKKAGGIVDMRNGGKVGAAVVAASLMANGGQAMDMRNGGRVRMQAGGRLPDILMKMAIEEQEEQARQAGQELSETEKAIDVTREGTTEPIKYMYDYGKRRQKRLSQVPPEHQFDERYSGSFSRRPGKKINVAPRMDVKTESGESFKGWDYRMGWGPQAEKEERRGFRDRFPFIGETRYPEKGAAIGTEQHEFIHAFLNFIKIATINRDTDKRYDEVLSTLSREDQIKLYKFLDFTQRQENPGGVSGPKAIWKRNRIEHELMDLDKSIQFTLKPGTGYKRQRFRTPGSPETLPEVYISQELDSPKGDTTYMHEGIGRSGTINQLAKAFNEAAAQNPEIHSRAKEKWVTSDTPSPDILFNFDNVVKQLQGEEFYESSARNTEQQQQLQQQQESFNQNKGGRIK